MSKAITSIKAAASKDAQTRSFEGAITTIIKKRLVGWALERNRPDISVDVDLMVGDVQIGTVTADGFSQELYDRGKGTGFHQFVTVPTLSGEFPGDWVGSVPIRLRASGTHEIFGEPFIVQVQTLRELVANRRIVGKIDGLGDGKIEGWIADLDVEDVAPPLILSLDGKTLSGLRTMRDETIVHQGRVIGGWRFAVQMPPSGRQGRLHLITARSDNTELDGSPMLFGPVPISNIVDAIAAQGRSISELRDRVAVLPAMQSTESLMDTLAERTLDRVDMLMSIYRDNIEHELGVMRNLLVSHLGSSVNGSDPLSVVTAPALPVTRTSPSIAEKIDFTADLVTSTGFVEIIEDGETIYGLLTDSVEIPLRRGAPNQYIVVEGTDGGSPDALMQWGFSISELPFLGRYRILPNGRWRFVGRILSMVGAEVASALTIAPTVAYVELAQAAPSLRISAITLTDTLVLSDRDGTPLASAEHVASRSDGSGWHNAELGIEGSYRWMGQRATLRTSLQADMAYRLRVIGENSMPYDTQVDDALFLFVNRKQVPRDLPQDAQGIPALGGDGRRFRRILRPAHPAGTGGGRWYRQIAGGARRQR